MPPKSITTASGRVRDAILGQKEGAELDFEVFAGLTAMVPTLSQRCHWLRGWPSHIEPFLPVHPRTIYWFSSLDPFKNIRDVVPYQIDTANYVFNIDSLRRAMAADMWAGLRVRVFNKPDFEKMLLFVKVPKTEVKRSSHKKMSRLVPDQQQILFL